MEKDSVPQDNSPTYAGLRKLLYAVDEQGKYTGVPSTGWEVESFATQTAVAELDRLRRDAWQRARDGKTAVLEFHMYKNRMELDTLSATTGLWRWRIKRHFNPKHFARLPDKILARYADAMGIAVAELRTLPEHAD
ncbi:MAG TPA: hypothetical protein VET48_02195 [Steroidobacteraceae bacterium]|nr:hypothetical protein [Steroidobacteraceae bacterium]